MVSAIPATLDDMTVFWVWVTGLLGTALAIVVVVLLIYGITRTLLVIDERLDGVLVTAQRILGNTSPLSDLEKTAKLAEQLRSTVAAIEEDAATVLGRVERSRV